MKCFSLLLVFFFLLPSHECSMVVNLQIVHTLHVTSSPVSYILGMWRSTHNHMSQTLSTKTAACLLIIWSFCVYWMFAVFARFMVSCTEISHSKRWLWTNFKPFFWNYHYYEFFFSKKVKFVYSFVLFHLSTTSFNDDREL